MAEAQKPMTEEELARLELRQRPPRTEVRRVIAEVRRLRAQVQDHEERAVEREHDTRALQARIIGMESWAKKKGWRP